jgi:hypothetical protein
MRRMTAQEARDHLARLGLSQQAAARLFRVNPKTVRRFVSLTDPIDIPAAVAIALELLTPAKVRRMLAELEADHKQQTNKDSEQ